MGSECPVGTASGSRDERALWVVVVMAAQQRECASCHRTIHLKMVEVIPFMLRVFYRNYIF